jgi:stringent starvation protein B
MATLPPKKEVLLELLEKSNVLMHLDARREDVIVPRNLKTNPQLVLQLGLNLAVPIRDLDVGDDGVKCTLSFNRTPFLCVLPYPAIFAMVAEDGRAMVWPEDVPVEVARAHEEEARREGKLPPAREPRAIGPTPNILQSKRTRDEAPVRARPEPKRAPKANKPAPAKPQAAEGDARAARPKRELPPYLRVIK